MKRLLLVLAIIALLGVPIVSACAPSKADVAAQQKEQCFANETQLKMEIDIFYADSQTYPPIEKVVAETHVACPAGGTYSFDPATDKVSCSIHGSQ
jgi:type II secretory pathway pseudopilin PulG